MFSMLFCPFQLMISLRFTFILSDRDFNLPQHLLIDAADRCAKLRNSRRSVPVEHAEKILMRKIFLRFHAASGHQGIGDADRGGVSERDSHVVLIIPGKKGIVNDGKNIFPMRAPVFVGELRRDPFKLRLQTALSLNIVAALQHRRNRLRVFRPVRPEVNPAGTTGTACIRNVKNIFDTRSAAAHIYKCDTLAAPAYIAPHALIPKVIAGAGGGLRALGINHELFGIWVLVQPRRRG
ncbi:MAG: hypothetical protein LUD54_02420 [Oscillospiraceae bacterium]|nr:hypothetical protein [Oscillospiraceae bacterium]